VSSSRPPGLVALILTLARTGRAPLSAAAVAAWIGAAYWFTSSTSFTHPAVTIARMFSDTFAGINPTSLPMFIVFQILGAGLALFLYPDARTAADAVVVPTPGSQPPTEAAATTPPQPPRRPRDEHSRRPRPRRGRGPAPAGAVSSACTTPAAP
jgi:hypothetical protein